MRPDVAGMFWDDTPPPKIKKEKLKATPPERVWESPDYLPGLEEALSFQYPYMTDAELLEAQQQKHPLMFDVECYINYFLVSFTSYVTGKVVCFEMDETRALDIQKLRWVMSSFLIVGFNSLGYDVPICEIALAGYGCEDLKRATQAIIEFGEKPGDILRGWRVPRLKLDHIDLIEVAPLAANLKIYGGRLHSPSMQDLPFPPETELSTFQKAIVKMYNVNSDLVSTAYIYQALLDQLELRKSLSAEYGIDLRSKSDAQIAEAVITAEVSRMNGARVQRPQVEPGKRFQYQPPAFLQYSTPLLDWMFQTVCAAEFVIDDGGLVGLPDDIKNIELIIGASRYQMGIGGLHSSEQRAVYFSNDTHTLFDRDVTSYYPQLILNSNMYPDQLGPAFSRVYQRIVSRRVQAKAQKLKVVADSLKITANGSFGKTGSPYSVLYAPHLMIQVTLTGQLSLLMLIERMELAGIPVVSANTDGIVMNCPRNLVDTYLRIVAEWERDTGLTTEETIYNAIYSRDVNNYLAVKPDGKVKAKGAYSNPWNDPELASFRFHKNPVNLICTEAVQAYVTKGVHPSVTVHGCNDPRQFVTVRTVRGGAVKDGDYLGKSVRWYYARGEDGIMVYAASGKKVPRSDGAKPLMRLPNCLPDDVDHEWYIAEACAMIGDLGLEPPAFARASAPLRAPPPPTR